MPCELSLVYLRCRDDKVASNHRLNFKFTLDHTLKQCNEVIKMLAFVCDTVGLFVIHLQWNRLICFIIRWTGQRDPLFAFRPVHWTAIGAPLIRFIRWPCVSWCWSRFNHIAGINCWYQNKQQQNVSSKCGDWIPTKQRLALSSLYLLSILARAVQLQWPLTFPLRRWICSCCNLSIFVFLSRWLFGWISKSLHFKLFENAKMFTAKICVYAPGYWPLWIFFYCHFISILQQHSNARESNNVNGCVVLGKKQNWNNNNNYFRKIYGSHRHAEQYWAKLRNK